MVKLEGIVLCLKIAIVLTRHEKPVHKTLWPQHCTTNSHALNDCNWCWCNEKHVFACHARVCSTVDMFGHFNDAIQAIDVGMEGHGVWRSTKTACEPGVQYQRENLLCICDEDGNWPNAVCRDIFRVLHAVELVGKVKKAKRCVATRLYVIGCNVCYCPSTGRIDLELCTKRNCTEDDPVLHKNKVKQPEETKTQELYAECSQGQLYEIGCRKCTCLSNNRLLCDECTEEIIPRAREGSDYCSNVKPGQIFSMDCNLCFCDKRHVIYCTTKQCINGPSKYYTAPSLFRTSNLTAVTAPYDDLDCTPGTKYIKGCNLCYCSRADDGSKVYSCTLKDCANINFIPAVDKIKAGCVKSQVYRLDCLICRCDVVDGIKLETCKLENKCTDGEAVKEARSNDLGSLRGYCEPYHNYQKDCNTCRCIADGKVVKCTPNVCNENKKQAISVDIVPVRQNSREPCPKSRMYKVDCNVCFCLSSGNVLCTTIDCNKQDAIQEIDVGMEGHGIWRSTKTACEPGVQYQRESLLCICDEDGNWPNAVCRDTFRVLHAVELVGKVKKAKRCVATRLYVIGCNVCFCPSTGRIDLELCTKRNCTEDDPVLHEKKVQQPEETKTQEFYAECSQGQEYEIGCRKCTCLSNNRLLCDECTEKISSRAKEGSHYCSNVKPGQIFSMNCNLCFCDKRHIIYCTTKQCINGPSKYYTAPSLFRTSNLTAVTAPNDDLDCIPGTKYVKGCNECYCSRADDRSKVYSCTLKDCTNYLNSAVDKIKGGCVKREVYNLNCLICRCDVVDGIKLETCKFENKCTDDEARSNDLGSLRGYCEPYHNYHKDCNTCRCLADGKVVKCTPNVCSENEKQAISVDIVPVRQNSGEPCPKNRMYKVDCNVCFCLSSGNVLCTTIDCNKQG